MIQSEELSLLVCHHESACNTNSRAHCLNFNVKYLRRGSKLLPEPLIAGKIEQIQN